MPLTQTYDDLRRDVGRQLFGGSKRDPSTWTAQNVLDVADILRDGYQAFLIPGDGYSWRWMRPVVTITVWPTQTGTLTSATTSGPVTTLVAATGTWYQTMVGRTITLSNSSYTIVQFVSATQIVVAGNASAATGAWTVTATGEYGLAEEIVGIDGNLFFDPSDAVRGRYIMPRNVEVVRGLRFTNQTGVPALFAFAPRAFDATQGQFWDISFHPIPDRVYNLRAKARVSPDILTAVNKYGMGGMPYSRALKLSCLAQVELQHGGSYGPQFQAYQLALAAAVAHDRKAFTPERLGKNDLGGGTRREGSTHFVDQPIKV